MLKDSLWNTKKQLNTEDLAIFGIFTWYMTVTDINSTY